MKLNEKEALRYLGFRGKPADADTDEMIREIGGEMLRTLTPKCVYKRYDIKALENAVELDGWLKQLVLTEEGIRFHENTIRSFHQTDDYVAGLLTEEENTELLRLLNKLRDALK